MKNRSEKALSNTPKKLTCRTVIGLASTKYSI